MKSDEFMKPYEIKYGYSKRDDRWQYENGRDAGECPMCGSDDTVELGGSYGGSDIWQVACECRACGAEWVENFYLCNAVITSEGSK